VELRDLLTSLGPFFIKWVFSGLSGLYSVLGVIANFLHFLFPDYIESDKLWVFVPMSSVLVVWWNYRSCGKFSRAE
jgi:hypothetical protein